MPCPGPLTTKVTVAPLPIVTSSGTTTWLAAPANTPGSPKCYDDVRRRLLIWLSSVRTVSGKANARASAAAATGNARRNFISLLLLKRPRRFDLDLDGVAPNWAILNSTRFNAIASLRPGKAQRDGRCTRTVARTFPVLDRQTLASLRWSNRRNRWKRRLPDWRRIAPQQRRDPASPALGQLHRRP